MKLVLALFVCFLTANAGILVVGGDVNTFDGLPGGAQPRDVGFFVNLLGGGNKVVVRDGYGSFESLIDSFYDGLTAGNSSIVGSFTAGNVAGADLLISPTPSSYGGGEAAVIAAFLAGGGSVYLSGEHQGFPTENAALNALLGAIGSGMSVSPFFNDCGYQVASGAQITGHPLMSGVNNMTYGCSSTILGGTALMLSKDLTNSMLSVEGGAIIPEPSTLALAALGLGLVAYRKLRS